MLDVMATQTCIALEPLLAANEVTAIRQIVASVGEVAGVKRCSLLLPDGHVLADSDIKAINVQGFPDSWNGPIENAVTESSDPGSSYLLRTINIRDRGPLVLRISFEKSAPAFALSDATGYSLLFVFLLLLIWFVIRTCQQRLQAMTKLAETLSALANRVDVPLEQFKLADSHCAGAGSWNRLIERFSKLEHSTRAEAMREFLALRDHPASAAKADGDNAGLGAVIDLLPTGVLVLEASGIVRACNGAGAALLGFDPAKAVGVDVRTLLSEPVFVDIVTANLNKTYGGERRSVEIDRRSEHGGIIRINIRPLRREDNGGCLVTVEDVTQQRIADSARNQFVAQATHELRAPLTNMRLSLEAALEDDASNVEALTQHLNVLNDETRRLERLVAEMLSVAEIEAGSLAMKEDDVRADRLFEELKANNIGACREKNQQLRFELPPKLPLLRGDRDKIAAALQNLLNNAIKYTPEGGQISVIARQEAERFIIEVSDTGFGIAAEEQSRIFERFYRAKDPRISKITGTGLGLALAREIARLHGGDLSFKSELNCGTTFTFQLPAAKQPA